ncbi:hypothetical protein [Saccharothrix longispora]|uniref:hypothetical protein n=1 Tax=Saccharothrix longispora TaxID=33920 RepID=UPI0028FD7F9D|nr:hypothetical protein [Saccharothrix longispora]MDU0294731.1 hypothetical protein [Saccharothrix longispora]
MDNDLYTETAQVETDYYERAADLGVPPEITDEVLRQAVFDAGRGGFGDPYELASSRLASDTVCRSRSHRCWSGSVSVLVDEFAEDAGAEHSVGVEVVYRGGVLPGFGW